MFDGFDEIFFGEVNEYTLVIADVALRNTSLTVTFKDRRIKLFDWLSSKVSVNDKPQSSNPLYVQKDFYVYFYLKGTHYTIDLFHDLFGY